MGSLVHVVVYRLGHLLALKVTAANEQERAQFTEFRSRLQEVTVGTVEVGFVDQEYRGESASDQAAQNGIQLEVVKHTEAKKGFVLLPRLWVVDRSFTWLGHFRRLVLDSERLTATLACWHWLAFLTLL